MSGWGQPHQGGYNQGGYAPQGGYNQGGYSQGGYHQQGGYGQPHYQQGPPPPQGGHHQGGYNQGGYHQPAYNQRGYQHPPPSHHPPPNYPPQGYGQPQPAAYRPPAGPPPPGYDAYGYPIASHPPQGQYNAGYNARGGPPPPPSGAQEFGHGAPQGYTFQYSNCTGRRRALLIGINYFGQQGELRGCINDVHNVSTFLMERFHYKREDMVFLTDDQRDPVMQPTKANMLRAMQWLITDAQPNDSLFFHYSGHGGQTKDLDGDEDDGYDEVIYPVDFKQAGHIVDDHIHNILVKSLRPGVRLTAIFDSCHSGSCLDLPYLYSTKGVLKEPNLAKEAAQGLFKAISAYAKGDLGGVASSIFGLAKSAYSGDDAYKKTVQTRTSPADVIMLSGSKDSQTSADATIASQATGAMSYAFIAALKQNPQQSYVQLLNTIRDILEAKYSQKPQLSCSHPLDTNLLFVM